MKKLPIITYADNTDEELTEMWNAVQKVIADNCDFADVTELINVLKAMQPEMNKRGLK